MRIDFNVQNPTIIRFKGIREDRNTVSQLKNDNAYSLNEPNQRRINIAIDNLAKQKGEENIRFLLNVGENLKYQTNIINGKKTKNDWRKRHILSCFSTNFHGRQCCLIARGAPY